MLQYKYILVPIIIMEIINLIKKIACSNFCIQKTNNQNPLIPLIYIGGPTDAHIYHMIQNNYQSQNYYDIMLEAASKGDIVCINWLISQNINIHYQQEEALKIACLNNHVEIVKLLLLHGANPTINKCDILLKCIQLAHNKIIKLILIYGYVFDNIYKQLLSEAIIHDNHKAVELLITYWNKFSLNGFKMTNTELLEILNNCLLSAPAVSKSTNILKTYISSIENTK